MDIWCSEVAALIGQSVHTPPIKALLTVLKRFIRNTSSDECSNAHGPHKRKGDAAKRRRMGCTHEKHVYRSVCMRKVPPDTHRFEWDRGLYRMIGHIDGVFDDRSIIEIKTRVSGVNRCFDHEYIQMQLYMEYLI